MTATEAAHYLRINYRQMTRLQRDPSFPVHRIGTGPKAVRRYYRAELDRWLRSRWSAQQAGTDR
jgi:hypothetical protein